MKFIISSVVTVTEPTDELYCWCKTNLTVNNPEYIKKLRMNLWVGNTPSTLQFYEIRGNELILPFGVIKRLPSEIIKDSTFTNTFKSVTHVDYGKPIELYPYQNKAVEECIKSTYGILQAPAGCGKTEMALALIKELGQKALFITHTHDLLTQAKNRAITRGIPKDLIGTITEGKVNIGKGITFATVQTLSRLDLPQYKDIWSVIIVDECHRVAGSPTSITQFYKVLNNLSAPHKYGLSATVHRSDGMIEATYSLLGSVIYSVPESDVNNKIMKVGINPIATGTGITGACLNTDGTLNYVKLITYLTMNTRRTEIIVNAIKSNKDKSCLILSDRLDHLESIMSQLPTDMQDQAIMISGKMQSKKDKNIRDNAIEEMRRGVKKYLFATYALAKEGLDVPRLERLFMATPQKDYAVITQSVGRIARSFEGKEKPVVYDFVDNIGYLAKSFKQRCSTYTRNGCYFVGD